MADEVAEVRALFKENKIWTTEGYSVKYGPSNPTHVNVLRKDFDKVVAMGLPIDGKVWELCNKSDRSQLPWHNKVFW